MHDHGLRRELFQLGQIFWLVLRHGTDDDDTPLGRFLSVIVQSCFAREVDDDIHGKLIEQLSSRELGFGVNHAEVT